MFILPFPNFLSEISLLINYFQEKLPGGAESLNPDVVEMQTLFSNVLRYKNDFQQRGWYLHDDEEEIQENLKRLLSILVSVVFFRYTSVVSYSTLV